MLRPTISRITAQAGVRRAFSSTPARPLAKITIIGNLTDSPELHATSTGNHLLRYSVASNSGPRDESGNQKVSYFRVTAFTREGGRRDFIQNLQKGTLVYVEGDATMQTYEDAEGKSRTALNIVQRSIDVLRRPRQAEDGSE
ncbi:single-strand binding protein family [Coniochaeta ligniaria NRRL 30616]|uniref:Single-stranded DNA-binding protein n=1 Tax=Coniochaeta ligniaria NRRL 30616 TaxID=1408157 RepID=A0A1J7J3A0_9PEZI|nr:single-strand binding protein family [Coniochaeta ligniaria NRRL 30616]